MAAVADYAAVDVDDSADGENPRRSERGGILSSGVAGMAGGKGQLPAESTRYRVTEVRSFQNGGATGTCTLLQRVNMPERFRRLQ